MGFNTFKQTREFLKKSESFIARAEVYESMNPCVTEFKRERLSLGGGVKADGQIFVDALVPIRLSIKSHSLEEVTRNVLILIGRVSLRATAMISAFRY